MSIVKSTRCSRDDASFATTSRGYELWQVPPSRPKSVCCLNSTEGRHLVYRLSRRALVLRLVSVCAPAIAMSADPEGLGKPEKTGRKVWWPPTAMKKMFACCMETGMGDYELAVASRKRSLFSRLSPNTRILDIGIGTGPNLAYLPNNVYCIGLDPNEYMKQYALRKASDLIMRNIELEVLRGTAEAIPTAEENFDAVVWYVSMKEKRQCHSFLCMI
jgi:Methyltransferase domain